jgi:hypothetical protein
MANSTLLQALSDSIHRAVNLRIITLVGDAQVTGALDQLVVAAPTTNGGSFVTDINIVGGDITYMVSDKLLGPEHASLQQSHAAAVTQAQQIVERNINILLAVAKQIGEDLGALPEPQKPNLPARTP